jgi:glycerate kinase
MHTPATIFLIPCCPTFTGCPSRREHNSILEFMPWKIAVAPNAFKGTLTASEAARYIERGLKRALPRVRIIKVPVADGGEGTAAAIVEATRGRWVRCSVHDPLGRRIRAAFGLAGNGRTAVIEMAAASGLELLKPHELDPLRASTFGTGQLVRAALDRQVREILVGIGGSATNDGGAGMARALGVRFLDAQGRELPEGGGSLPKLARIDLRRLDPRLKHVEVTAACDVDNPLCGPRGAARVYGPQKGATPAMVKTLDTGLKRLAAVIKRDLGVEVAHLPGAGAAGGLGAGLVAFLHARMRSGVGIVIDAIDLRRKLQDCDLVITGEGRLDGQTAFGKAPAGVARTAKSLGLPVIAICGSLGADAAKVRSAGIDACFSALEELIPAADLSRRAPGMLERCAEQVGRILATLSLDKV